MLSDDCEDFRKVQGDVILLTQCTIALKTFFLLLQQHFMIIEIRVTFPSPVPLGHFGA